MILFLPNLLTHFITNHWAWWSLGRNVGQRSIRAQPHLQLFATDACPSGAGACSAPVSLELRTRLCDFADEKGCSVRLDAVAGLVVGLPWVESFSCGLVDRGLVVCSVWSTAELFLDQFVRDVPAANV